MENTSCLQGCTVHGTLIHCCSECKMEEAYWKTTGQFLIKLNIHLPYDSAIPLLNIYPREMKTGLYKNLYMDVYNSCFHNFPNVEPPTCPSTAE